VEIDKVIGRILDGYQPACVVMAANELKLFDQLKQPTTAEQAAKALNLDSEATERLLNSLTSLEIITKENQTYHLPETAHEYLTTGGGHSLQQWIQLSADLYPVWGQLSSFIKSGILIKSIMEMLGSDPHKMRAFTDAMHDKALKATWMIAREIPIGDAKTMLDIGGGPGTYSLEWCKLHTHLKATVFDIAPVLEVTKSYIETYKLQSRVNTKPGNFHKDDLGDSQYDLVIMANILHMYDADMSKALVTKAVKAVKPGGRIVIHGFCTDENQTGPLGDTLFSLNIGMLTEGGRAHPVQEKIDWLEEAGISDIRHFRIDAIPTGVITGVTTSGNKQ
jgi:ubiquinone/menaquinone biosynthesis C-methylase UbiE